MALDASEKCKHSAASASIANFGDAGLIQAASSRRASGPCLRSRLRELISQGEDGMGFEAVMDAIARGVEVLGIMTLVLGLAAALVRAGLALLGR
jgi:hypothetical protein